MSTKNTTRNMYWQFGLLVWFYLGNYFIYGFTATDAVPYAILYWLIFNIVIIAGKWIFALLYVLYNKEEINKEIEKRQQRAEKRHKGSFRERLDSMLKAQQEQANQKK